MRRIGLEEIQSKVCLKVFVLAAGGDPEQSVSEGSFDSVQLKSIAASRVSFSIKRIFINL